MFSTLSTQLRIFAVTFLLLEAPAIGTSPQASSQSQNLSTKHGISDDHSGGTELKTGPLSQLRAAGTQPNTTQQGLPSNGSDSYPYIIAPYVQVPGVAPPPRPTPVPRPAPHP